MLDWRDRPETDRATDRTSNARVFRGTRIPIKVLFELSADGATLDEFLGRFPGVRRDRIIAALRHAS
ncbi:MAG: DUF433 domain-containing protein [Planctomycetota bacterium]|nr:DUF433 domain-containing protein [Planctomycetota bacterium]